MEDDYEFPFDFSTLIEIIVEEENEKLSELPECLVDRRSLSIEELEEIRKRGYYTAESVLRGEAKFK